jgi:hypothetical protein
MIEFDLFDPSEGIYFPYQKSTVDEETGEIKWGETIEGSKFLIRSIAPFIEDKLKQSDSNRVREFVHNKSTNKMELIEYTPEKTFSEQAEDTNQMYIWAIVSWEGIGSSGQLLEVTDENKIRLSKNLEFQRFFDKCQKELKKESSVWKKESEKNS